VRICVIFNPTAKGDKARKFRRHLASFGSQATLKQTRAAGDARALAREAVQDGFDVVAAAGGDGTVNEVLNGLGDVPDAFANTRLGVIPLGTVNVFARELGIPLQLEAAWAGLMGGRESVIDLPSVECIVEGKRVRRYFAQLAGAGLDAAAIELVQWPLKKRIGPLAYVVAGLHALLKPQGTIAASDGERVLQGELVLLGNGRLYGGSFAVFPRADMRDGCLEVCVFPRVNWWQLARCGPALLLRGRLPARATLQLKSKNITLTSTVRVAVEVDGELAGELPATFQIQRSALRVAVP
jgi:diacylglycerol kinase (ATP)